MKTQKQHFRLGRIVSTPNAISEIIPEEIISALCRHENGDWGDCCPEDKAANDAALLEGSRLFSVYHTANQTELWIITEWDRSATTILLPEDY